MKRLPAKKLRARAWVEFLEHLEPRLLFSATHLIKSATLTHKGNSTFHSTLAFETVGKGTRAQGLTAPLSGSIAPAQMEQAYGMNLVSFGNATNNGAGQTIAIVDVYDDPNALQDLDGFSSFYGLPQFNQPGGPTFQKVAEDGSSNFPPTDPAGAGNANGTWEVEESIDIEWAHAMAPYANIVLVEASSTSNADLFQNAVNTARNLPGVSVVSMSFGGSEFFGENSYDTNFTTPAGHIPITFVASSGDNGEPPEYPSVSPNVVAVGGTSLTLNGNGYGSEVAWGFTSSNKSDASGGGISTRETQPSYQSGLVPQSSTRRTTPDVSLDADPNTGVEIYDSFDYGAATPWFNGQWGGTSLAAPMFAGMIAVADQGRVLDGLPTLGGANNTLPDIYSLPASDYHDITSGSNGFSAGPGYDLVTGRGSPIGNLFIADLVGNNSISGTLFQDNNGDGVNDSGDQPVQGATVFIDSNNNGVLDPGGSQTLSSGTLNVAIPDNNSTGVSSTLNVSGLAGLITHITVTLNILHNSDNQLSGYLIGPDNTSVTLFTGVGGSNGSGFTNTTFDDLAPTSITSGSAPFTGSFQPSPGKLSTFNGELANGNWTLRITDTVSTRHNPTQQLLSWSITVTTGPELSTTTAADGSYSFSGLFAGNYTVRDVLPTGDIASGSTSASMLVTGPTTAGNFGVFPTVFNSSTPGDIFNVWVDPDTNFVEIGKGLSPTDATYQYSIASLPSLRFNLTGAGSQVIINYVNGSPAPSGGIVVDGGGLSDSQLTIIGNAPGQNFAVTDSQVTLTDTPASPITYQNLATLTLVNSSFDFSGTLATLQNLNLVDGAAFYWVG